MLVDLVASRSYIITASEEERATRLEGVRRLTETHPDLAGHAVISLPYVTRCSRTHIGSA